MEMSIMLVEIAMFVLGPFSSTMHVLAVLYFLER